MPRKSFSWTISLVLAMVLLSACGGPAVAPAPSAVPSTATAVPPTATPVPPTATPVPTPTATPVPAVPTAIPEAVDPATTVPSGILFVGDSFTFWNEGIEKHLRGLAASCDPSLTIDTARSVLGGADLRALWDHQKAPNAIRDGNWDVVVLQEDLSMRLYNEQEFYEYARKFDQEIREAGARTVLYMAQDYASDNYKTTVAEIAQAYDAIGSELDADVAPVALAWERSIGEQPDLNLYDRDQIHPSVPGTYLTTSVLFSVIFGRSPEGCTYLPLDLFSEGTPVPDEGNWDMSEEEAAFLRRVAWETVEDYRQVSSRERKWGRTNARWPYATRPNREAD